MKTQATIKCDICGKPLTTIYDAHPYIENGKCCGECCANKVAPFRLAYRYLFGYNMDKLRKRSFYMDKYHKKYDLFFSSAIFNALKHDKIFEKDLVKCFSKYISFDYTESERDIAKKNNWIVNSQYDTHPLPDNKIFAQYSTVRGWIVVYTNNTDTMILFDDEFRVNSDILLM